MAIITWLLNWNNINKDWQIWIFWQLFTPGIIYWFDITDNWDWTLTVWPWLALVGVNRWSENMDFLVVVRNSDNYTLWKNDWILAIKVDYTKIQDGAWNSELWDNIATIEIQPTENDFSPNFIEKLTEISGWNVNDIRQEVGVKLWNKVQNKFYKIDINDDWNLETNEL